MQHKFFLSTLLFLLVQSIYGQETYYPIVSGEMFVPYVYNPAIVGTKDYTSFNFASTLQNNTHCQILNVSTRLMKKRQNYYLSGDSREFRRIGVGASLINSSDDNFPALSAATIFSYHLKLDRNNLAHLSFGSSVKANFDFNHNTFRPDLDLGIFYYGKNLYLGFATNNLLFKKSQNDTLPVSRILQKQNDATLGCRILISKPLKLVLEPSVFINLNDSTAEKINKNVHPSIRVYWENLCLGSYFFDYRLPSFFFQYRFPGVYLGLFMALPKNAPYYAFGNPLIEISVGFNIASGKPRFPLNSNW